MGKERYVQRCWLKCPKITQPMRTGIGLELLSSCPPILALSTLREVVGPLPRPEVNMKLLSSYCPPRTWPWKHSVYLKDKVPAIVFIAKHEKINKTISALKLPLMVYTVTKYCVPFLFNSYKTPTRKPLVSPFCRRNSGWLSKDPQSG